MSRGLLSFSLTKCGDLLYDFAFFMPAAECGSVTLLVFRAIVVLPPRV